jgi:hypothetical protein
MSDKYLTAKEWQKFAAGRGYKDAALVKTLAAAEKADNAPAAEQLEVLKAVETAGRALIGLHKGDKKLEAYLDDVAKAVKLARKDAEATQAKDEKADAAKAAKERDEAKGKDGKDDKDDEKANVLLDPKRMLAQLMACRKDPARKIQFAYVDGKDKVPAAAAMSHNVSGRKMFALLSEENGVKTGSYGEAWVQGTELMLQPEKALGGLAKKMRAPVKACGFKVTAIVLWNADGTLLEKDATADDGDAPADATHGSAASAQPAAKAEHADAPAMSEADLVARLKALLPRVVAAQASLEGQAAKLLASEAGTFMRKGDLAGASANLDKVDKLLARLGNVVQAATAAQGAAAASTPATAAAAPQKPATSPKPDEQAAAGLAADWNKARALWQAASDSVDNQLETLRTSILDWLSSDDEDVEMYGEAMKDIAETGLNSLTKSRRVNLIASIMDLGAGDPSTAKAKAAKALQHVREFEGFIQSSSEVAATDDNPLDVPVSIRATLTPPLRRMASVLEAAARP